MHDALHMTRQQVISVSQNSVASLPENNYGAIEDNASSPLVPEDVQIHESAPDSIAPDNCSDHGNFVSDNVSNEASDDLVRTVGLVVRRQLSILNGEMP
ncbi:hypothetical protein V6N11_001927 [Hibiscus sabdariffa]|uniref:Uncharacterized protein n=1 Tax=Hibiscus sabdariffa TaxID=183260 RepID=A0ABR2QUH6_9ROSI